MEACVQLERQHSTSNVAIGNMRGNIECTTLPLISNCLSLLGRGSIGGMQLEKRSNIVQAILPFITYDRQQYMHYIASHCIWEATLNVLRCLSYLIGCRCWAVEVCVQAMGSNSSTLIPPDGRIKATIDEVFGLKSDEEKRNELKK